MALWFRDLKHAVVTASIPFVSFINGGEHRWRQWVIVNRTEAGVYPEMPLAAAPQFQRVLARLLSAQGASMVHCSAGKDRTGVFSALLLLTLGVPRETVIEDYLLTNRYAVSDDTITRTAVAYQKLLGLDRVPPTEVLKPVMSVDRSYIDAALETIDKEYGSFDEYRRKKLHLSDPDAEQLRDRYLEP